MRRLLPFLLASKRRLRRATMPRPKAPPSEPADRRPPPLRKVYKAPSGFWLMKPPRHG